MATLKTLQTTAQHRFILVSVRCSSASCITGYTNQFRFQKGHSIVPAVVHIHIHRFIQSKKKREMYEN